LTSFLLARSAMRAPAVNRRSRRSRTSLREPAAASRLIQELSRSRRGRRNRSAPCPCPARAGIGGRKTAARQRSLPTLDPHAPARDDLPVLFRPVWPPAPIGLPDVQNTRHMEGLASASIRITRPMRIWPLNQRRDRLCLPAVSSRPGFVFSSETAHQRPPPARSRTAGKT